MRAADRPDADDRPPSWGPSRAAVVVGWALTAAAAVGAVTGPDPGAVMLLGVAALALGLLSLFGTVANPRLTADHTGITVRGLTGARHWPWSQVNVRLNRTRRFGRESTAVEIDAERADPPALVLLGRLDLGTDPQDVAEALVRLRT